MYWDNILAGPWGNVGRYLNTFGVQSKEKNFSAPHIFPRTHYSEISPL